MARPTSILITGASSGIGAALARTYAEPGVHLALAGRNGERLEAVAGDCRAIGAKADTRLIDVTDEAAMDAWIREVDAARPLDLVIANAGISTPWDLREGLREQLRRVLAVNLEGVINTVQPALDVMRERRHGQIAIVSSIAGFHGMPRSPAYSVSKCAVKAYGEALRGLYAADGIRVSVICPGFVETPMTAKNTFPMPFLMPPERAARIIRRGLARNAPRIVFPWQMLVFGRLLGLLPERLVERLLRA